MKRNTTINSILVKAFFFIVISLAFLSESMGQHVLDNSKLRFGNGTEQSINATGNLRQPFYFNPAANTFYPLTYSNYPLDNAYGIGGDKTNEWNTNGTIVVNPFITNQVIDASGFIFTSGNKGYGTIVSTGSISVGGQMLEVRNTYMLSQEGNFVRVTTRLRNTSSSLMENVRYWIGTRDDWVGTFDNTRKQKGSLVDNAFVQNTSSSARALALKVSTGNEGVLFYTAYNRANVVVHPNYGDFYFRIVQSNPSNTSVDVKSDGSYGMYVRLNDLPVGASHEFTWYYAAGDVASFDAIISEVAKVSGAVQNISYTTATLKATSSANSTGYWMVVPRNSPTPTAEQIKAGVNYGSVIVAASGSGAMAANVEQAFEISGLNAGTNYDVYFISQDASNAFSSVLSVRFATKAYAAPTVSTAAITNLTRSSVTSGGNVSADGGQPVTERGVVWSTSGSPTIANNKVTAGTGTGAFSTLLADLSPNTVYYIRAYATNAIGTSYGNQLSFTTPPADPTAISVPESLICPGSSTTLTASGVQGTVYWYTEACGGKQVGTGPALTVTPAATTTYYARNYNGSFSEGCASITITVEDKVAPVAKAKDITVQLSASGTATIKVADINDNSFDGCGIKSLVLSKTSFSCSDVGANTVTLTVTDNSNNVASATATVTIVDNIAPVVNTKSLDVFLEPSGSVTITAADIDKGSSDACGIRSMVLDQYSFTSANLGRNTVRLTVTDNNDNVSSSTAVVTVAKRPTSLSYVAESDKQYSDPITLRARLIDQLTGNPMVGKTINFTLGTQTGSAVTGETGEAVTTLIVTQEPGNYAVVAAFAEDSIYLTSTDRKNFKVLPEDVQIDYTGALFASTSGTNSSTASVTLSATIQDMDAVAVDPSLVAGDIKNAKVLFKIIETGNIIEAPINYISELDKRIGTATTSWSVDIGSESSKQFTVQLLVGGNYYTGPETPPSETVTVSKPLNELVTGGGYIILTNSAGEKKGDIGSKCNFGFNVKYNKGGSNPQGSANIIFRRTEADGLVHVYQIKGNVMNSLAVNHLTTTVSQAVFTGRVSIQDITNPKVNVPVEANVTLQVELTDMGEPGSADKIGISIWKNGSLWFSSTWSGVRTLEKTLAGGNLVIRGVGTANSVDLDKNNQGKFTAESNFVEAIKAYPNPVLDGVTLDLGGLPTDRLKVIVIDVVGRTRLQNLYTITGESMIEVDMSGLTSGAYFIQVQSEQESRVVKVLKQ